MIPQTRTAPGVAARGREVLASHRTERLPPLGATIRRGPRPVDNFTLISNALLRDTSLSLKARGLAAWLWSHAETYSLSVDRIADQTGAGLAAVRTGIQELEARGYLVRE